MRVVRFVTAVALFGALTLPFAAPVLCTLVDPGMTAADMIGHSASTTIGDRDDTERCDFADCARAPVAPTVDVATVSDTRGVLSVADSASPRSVFEDPGTPLTPPPRV